MRVFKILRPSHVFNLGRKQMCAIEEYVLIFILFKVRDSVFGLLQIEYNTNSGKKDLISSSMHQQLQGG